MCAFRQTHFSPKPQHVHKRKHSLSFLSLLRGHEGYIPREVRSGCARSPDEQVTFSVVCQDKGIKNSCSRSPPIEELLKTNSNLQHSSPSQGWQLVDNPKMRDHHIAFLASLLGKEQSRSCHISETPSHSSALSCVHTKVPPMTEHLPLPPPSLHQTTSTAFTAMELLPIKSCCFHRFWVFFIYKSN